MHVVEYKSSIFMGELL